MTAVTARSGAHIPWLFVGGFALVIAVNAVMVWFAVSSFSGLYSAHPRDDGLRYNETLARQRARDALGWVVEVAWEPATRRLTVAARDAAGAPLAGARVEASLVRPAEKRAPLALALQPVDLGRFAAAVDLPAHGNWDVDVIVDAGGQRWAATRRMVLQ